ncbi:MAG: DEAD/DEAH box helicase, partial [Staphylococcus equorum]|nr:DEAD/DEAH box helicase [Staphylococcus equorum]
NRIKTRYVKENTEWEFKNNLTYKDYEAIIKDLERHRRRRNVNIVIGQSVYDYIESSKFEIAEIARRGMLIKNKDESLITEVDKFNAIVNNEMADDFSLRGVQRWVSYYMTKMQRVANFSVPGSGKTAMVYGAYAYLSSEKVVKVKQIIMIGPKSSFISWKDEFKKVFGQKRRLRAIDIHDEEFHESMFYRNPHDYDLVLVNYESIAKYETELKNIINNQTMIVFDEVHKIKKIDSERAAIAIDLSSKTDYRYVLTGTPIPNSYLDIWNFLHVLYNEEYNEYFGLSVSELANVDGVIQDRINEKLAPFFWRVTKKDLNVPPANPDEIYKYTASDLEQSVIDLLWKKYRHIPLKLYIRLIQFSSNPSLLSKNINRELFLDTTESAASPDRYTFEYDEMMNDDVSDFYTEDELLLLEQLKTTKKFEACISKVDDLVNQGKPVIVWCIFVDTINKVARRVEELGHHVKIINGSVSAIEREKIVKEFQENKIDVLVTNPHTLAESVSLHMACHDAIYLEYSFNLTHMLQSRDRIHRLGLPEDSYTAYYYFMLEGQEQGQNTIDEKVYTRLKEKEKTMLAAVENDNLDIIFSKNEKDEILDLMEEVID